MDKPSHSAGQRHRRGHVIVDTHYVSALPGVNCGGTVGVCVAIAHVAIKIRHDFPPFGLAIVICDPWIPDRPRSPASSNRPAAYAQPAARVQLSASPTPRSFRRSMPAPRLCAIYRICSVDCPEGGGCRPDKGLKPCCSAFPTHAESE